MRGLSFRLASGLYVLRLADVETVLPFAALSSLAGANAAMAGLLNLRGKPVPVFDMGMACVGRHEPVSVRSRIVMLAGAPVLGVLLNTTGETVAMPAQGLEPCPVDLGKLSFLDGVSSHRGQLLQWLEGGALRRWLSTLSALSSAVSHA